MIMASLKILEGMRGLKILHMNTRSLKSKYSRLLIELHGTDYDVICITESWLKDEDCSSVVELRGYDLHRNDRTWIDPVIDPENPKEAGGVCMYIKSDIQHDATELQHINLSNKDIELQCVKIDKPNNKRLVIVNCYRPPKGDKAKFVKTLQESMDLIPHVKKIELIVTGDVNIDLLKPTETHAANLVDTLKPYRLLQLIKEATRSDGKSSTLLDVIFTNSQYVSKSGIINVNISDHVPVYMLKKKEVVYKPRVPFVGRSYKNYKIDTLRQDIEEGDWSVFDDSNDQADLLAKTVTTATTTTTTATTATTTACVCSYVMTTTTTTTTTTITTACVCSCLMTAMIRRTCWPSYSG